MPEFIVLGRPHLMLADANGDDRVAIVRQARQLADRVLRENAGAVPPAVGKLSEAVSVLVQYLKQRGDPPERVVIEVKHVVRAAYQDARFPLDPDTRRLVDNVITWAIEAYYGVR